MKLLRARFTNFRLLRDLELEFAAGPEDSLTVIRAENDTGKTTLLTALQWAFYGDAALPGDAKSFRLHPIDAEGEVDICVELDFETAPSGSMGERRSYRVVRRATEIVNDSTWRRREAELLVYELTEKGAKRQEYGENRIRIELPPELREVFFTDGDRALSFIDADSTSVKRQRVESAIKSLLGLSVIEDAGRHVKQVASDVNRKVRETGAGVKAQEESARIERFDATIAEEEEKLAKAREDHARCEEQCEHISKKIEAALSRGNREELNAELRSIQGQRDRSRSLQLAMAKDQGELIKSKTLAKQLLSGHIAKSTEMLEELKEKDGFPKQSVPVLAERIEQGKCICGETLDPEDDDGRRRKEHIEHLIDASRAADAIQKIITELYYGARELMDPGDNEDWKDLYSAHFDRRQKVAKSLADLAAREAQVEAKIDEVPDVDVQHLREQRKIARRNADDNNSVITRATIAIDAAKEGRRKAEEARDRALKEEDRGNALAAELTVAHDVLGVFDRALERLKSDELVRVSSLMNDIFLEMIGADEAQGAIIRRASISPEFDILVHGPGDRLLNPDHDLNGASRRALTLAFILALTQVSGVEAPNIIDTPLGMMSGYVKSSVVQVAMRHSSQLILFLTRSEIAGTEGIISQHAGIVVTLTNPAHYPRMLLNEPETDVLQALKCDCDHTMSCKTCDRRMDVEPVKGKAELEAAE